MNIAKHKEILVLREEFNSLEQEYHAKQSAVVEEYTDKLLTAAVKEFIEYVRNEGFEVDGDENGTIKANLEGIVITLERKPMIMTVYMPNGERYSVYPQTTLEYKKPTNSGSTSTQDNEIAQLKKTIENVKAQFSLIESQEFRYILSTDRASYGIQHNRQSFLKFKDILPIMFS